MTSLAPLSSHGLWLLPDEPVASWVRDRIRTLGGPAFEPHATVLGSLPDREVGELALEMRELARELAPITAACDASTSWSEPWQTVVIPLRPVGPFERLRARAAAAFRAAPPSRPSPPHRPHMSLCYGSLKALEVLARKRDQPEAPPPGSVTFSRLGLVSLHGLPPDWKILETCALEA